MASKSSITADRDTLEWFREFKRDGETTEEFLVRVCSILEQRDGNYNTTSETTPNRDVLNRLDDLEAQLPRKVAEELSKARY